MEPRKLAPAFPKKPREVKCPELAGLGVTWEYKVGKNWIWYHPVHNTFTAVGWGRNKNRGSSKIPLGPGGHEISWDEARGYFSSYAAAKKAVEERQVGAHVPSAGCGTNL